MTENPEHLNIQAIELAAQGDFPEALACLRRAIALEKENYLLWFNMGITYRDSGDLESAKRAFKQANTINPEDEEVLETLALTYFSLGAIDKAFAICEDCLELNPYNAQIWNTIGVMNFTHENYEEAAASFEKAVSIDPHYFDALYNLRDTYEELGNEEAAKECDDKLKMIKMPGYFYA
ncbi:MAG TPA: tetratricopeptide repeat protein [Treponemataceae bacterium]|jgi:tetratricopeptide (TPR) repeat protein|nr:tetratricopeptide repeat protein [Spirochaetota bacterium]NMA56850.1 tetratricopeptide repeat protein [Treponema sp.]HOF11490.1 tetratricopeptide repeat protein [Treponemataceae bacterium]HOQ93013.1 tetratricopeptide repeat protein [Treponemataceae bacterium]HPM06561.1 tetratricopeptide repeat protein [Treponemataceae bacterium]